MSGYTSERLVGVVVAITVWAVVVALMLGAAVGSFLNVVAYRLPLGLSLLWPGSRCPDCLTPLGATENIPVLGWLLLQGRCKHCQRPIAPRYPLVELLTAGLFALIVLKVGVTVVAAGYMILVALLLALSLIDFDTLELPHELTLPGIYLGLGWQMGVIFGDSPLIGLLEGLLGYGVGVLLLDTIAVLGRIYLWLKVRSGALLSWQPVAALGVLGAGWGLGLFFSPQVPPWAVGLAFYGAVLLSWDTVFILRSFGQKPILEEADELVALGGGDVLLAGLLGSWLGWQGLLVALAVGFLTGTVYGLGARLSQRLGALERFAFGPFLALGGVVSLLWGNILIDNYLGFLGIT
ncbi:A24 family peptidase [Candidatus Cyanaurora vandensis]|uniref:prepilin peptidase n=1 Tax=Candidatus Cyanaurora vandensis TaxID=2714958 RepID=UPI00257FBAA4|nr:A24 family peptidase [Candidatus Cyanaurora vandensis]